MKKIVIFIDYQNVYKTSQNIFEFTKKGQNRHIDLAALVNKIISKLSSTYKLDQIRVYTGIPSRAVQPNSYWNSIKRFERWKENPRLIIQSRTLKYSKLNKESDYLVPREKGIDVLLAVDLVSMAFEKKFDTAIIFSLDTDLKPALEFVQKLQPKTEIFVAAWRKKSSEPRQLSLKGNYPNCIWLNQEDYLNSLLN